MSVQTQDELGSGLAAQSDFRSIDTEDAGVATGCAQGAGHLGSGQKPKLHQAMCDVGRKIDAIEDPVFAPFEFSEGARGPGRAALLLETQLHYDLSMEWFRSAVNIPKHINATETVLVSVWSAEIFLAELLTL